MPLSSPISPSVFTITKSSLGSVVKDAANRLRYSPSDKSTASDYVKLFGATGDAFGTVQKQIDQIVQVLQTPLPQVQEIQVLDPNGNLLADMGDFIEQSTNIGYTGIWTVSMWSGGQGPSNATVKINITPNIAIDVNGIINATGYQAGGTSGISTTKIANTLSFTTSGSGVFGTPGAGQSNGVVVTGITVSLVSMTFTDGLLTA